MFLEFRQGYGSFGLTNERNVDQQPARIFFLAFRVVVLVIRIELRGIRICFAGDLGKTDDGRYLAARMIKSTLSPMFMSSRIRFLAW